MVSIESIGKYLAGGDSMILGNKVPPAVPPSGSGYGGGKSLPKLRYWCIRDDYGHKVSC